MKGRMDGGTWREMRSLHSFKKPILALNNSSGHHYLSQCFIKNISYLQIEIP